MKSKKKAPTKIRLLTNPNVMSENDKMATGKNKDYLQYLVF